MIPIPIISIPRIYELCVAAAPHLWLCFIRRMTITFENNNDVIVYALEKILSYPRDNQYIFLAQSVWWISSIIQLQQELVVHIDTLRIRLEVPAQRDTVRALEGEVSVTPRDIQGDRGSASKLDNIHPDRIFQVQNIVPDNSSPLPSNPSSNSYQRINPQAEEPCQDISDLDLDSSEPDWHLWVIKNTKQFFRKSRKEQKKYKKQADLLSWTRSGKVIAKPLTQGQYKYLQCLPKDTIAAYLKDRN